MDDRHLIRELADLVDELWDRVPFTARGTCHCRDEDSGYTDEACLWHRMSDALDRARSAVSSRVGSGQE